MPPAFRLAMRIKHGHPFPASLGLIDVDHPRVAMGDHRFVVGGSGGFYPSEVWR